MAAVDSLLRLMTVRGADLLVVAAGSVPKLRRGGLMSALSMPALDTSLVDSFVTELIDTDERADLERDGALETLYHTEEGASFAVKLETKERGMRLTFRPRGDGGSARGREPAARLPVRPGAPSSPPPPGPGPDPGPAARRGEPATIPLPRASNLVPRTAPLNHTASDPGLAHAETQPVMSGVSGHPGVAPVISDELLAVFERADYERASDIILSAGHAPLIRAAGRFIETTGSPCDDDDIEALLAVAGLGDRRALAPTGSADFSLEPRPGLRFRVNAFHQQDGLAAALRPVRSEIPSLDQLGLPDHLNDLVGYPHGLVLMCGPTGSGKSTTLVALIEHLNRTRPCHIITLEDPIEYRYTARRALIHQREIGVHVSSFAAGLRAALRESPDVILVGEMRDRDTIAAALTAAETGHLVLSTIHSSSAVVAVDRIIDVFPEQQQGQVRLQLSTVLRAILTQFLLPSTRPPGRVPAFEKMIVTDAIAHQIRERKVYQIPSQIQTGRNDGMVPLERTLAALIRKKRITLQTARDILPDPAVLMQLLRDG